MDFNKTFVNICLEVMDSSDDDSVSVIHPPLKLFEEILEDEDEDDCFEFEYVIRCINGVELIVQRFHRVKILNYIEVTKNYLDDGFIQHFRLNRELIGEIIERYQNSDECRCILSAIDGTHITIDQPDDDPDSYVNRKRYYSLHMQGFVDCYKKFRDIFIGYQGSVHDVRVFKESLLYHNLEAFCEPGTFILGDSAYPCLPQLIVPFRDNGHLTRAQKKFNTKLSSGRIVVEHAFGILKQRFRQLYNLKLRSILRMVKFIHACCVLHNMANESDLDYLEPPPPEEEEETFLVEEVNATIFDEDRRKLRDNLCRQLSTM